MSKPLRIAAFGFRSFPPRNGSAGADKFAMELLPRLAKRGNQVIAYNRLYPGMDDPQIDVVDGVEVKSFRTVAKSGFDTLVHSAQVTCDIIVNNRADVVHIQNGGNSIFGAVLRLFGKRTYLSQDGLDWEREKWPWYAKTYLYLSSFLTAWVHNAVIFDNIYARAAFEEKFKRKYDFIPFGADVDYKPEAESILDRLGLRSNEYFLFVGRFIPDKGLHWLVPAYEKVKTTKKLVLVGGSPNPSEYEGKVKATKDERILFTGFLYGAEVHALMRNCYAYVQPSAIEGLSPVILESTFLGAPVICADIPQNSYGLAEFGTYFRSGDEEDLRKQIEFSLANPDVMAERACHAGERVSREFSWDKVVDQHIAIFEGARASDDGVTAADGQQLKA